MELIVVPRDPGPLLHIATDDGAGRDLRRRSGVPVDGSDPDVASLLDAYDAIWATAPADAEIVAAAHIAVLQTASLLRFGPPAGPAEREYVRRQIRAIAELTGGDPTGPLAYLRVTISGG